MSVVPVDDLYIDANFKETQIGLMRIGQPVTVSVDALSGRDLQGAWPASRRVPARSSR